MKMPSFASLNHVGTEYCCKDSQVGSKWTVLTVGACIMSPQFIGFPGSIYRVSFVALHSTCALSFQRAAQWPALRRDLLRPAVPGAVQCPAVPFRKRAGRQR